MAWLSNPAIWATLLTLTLLEIVLGIDNIIFIALLVAKLPRTEQKSARMFGLALALVARILLLLSLSWVMRLTRPLFTLPISGDVGKISGRDLILLLGGLFLIVKSARELLSHQSGAETVSPSAIRVAPSYRGMIAQIALIDIVFSLDSVITAVGMAKQVGVMIGAVILVIMFMMAFSGSVSRFIESQPTIKTLALAFLVLVGVNLVAEGMEQHIPKGYLYFSMAFALVVEFLNIRTRSRTTTPSPANSVQEPSASPPVVSVKPSVSNPITSANSNPTPQSK